MLAPWPFCKTVHLKTCFENDLANWCDQALRAIRQRYPNLVKLHSNTLHKKSHKPKEGFQVNSSILFCFVSFTSHQCSEWKWINFEKEVRSNQASFKDWIYILKEGVLYFNQGFYGNLYGGKDGIKSYNYHCWRRISSISVFMYSQIFQLEYLAKINYIRRNH